MNQRPLAVNDSSSARASEGETGTAWFGRPRLSWSDIISSAQKSPHIEQELERQESETARTASAVSDRLVEAIDVISAVTQTPVEERFVALQEWEGFVFEVGEQTFVARLHDMTCKDSPEEESDFLIDDVRKDDLKLLRPGAVFRWVIGYDIKKDGAKRRASQIVFRRLPQWTRNEIEEADKEAQTLLGTIEWE